jgi:dTDP-4-dehydrorhamnose reductase
VTYSEHGLKLIETKLAKYETKPKRVLFTGGSGLLALNWAMAIKDNYTVALGLHQKNITLCGFEHYQIDIKSVERLAKSLEEIKPDIVIHAAGLTNVEQCEKDPNLAFHVNAEISEVVAKVCFQKGLQLVHISTDHIFSGKESLVSESQPLNPINKYGETKAEAEALVLKAYPEALVVRTNFFGWGTSYRKSFSDIIIEGLRAKKQLVLFEDVFYTPILVENLAFAVHDLIDQQVHGIINIVGDERISKYQFGIKIAEKFGLDCKLINRGLIGEISGLVQRPKDMSLTNQKACKLIGRKLGNVNEYLTKLMKQEKSEVFQEIIRL